MTTKHIYQIDDAENKQIQTVVDTDSDAPEWTESDFKHAKPAKKTMPGIVEAYNSGGISRRTRGLQKSPTKIPISIRIDSEVLNYYRKSGPGWHAKINADLKKLIETHRTT